MNQSPKVPRLVSFLFANLGQLPTKCAGISGGYGMASMASKTDAPLTKQQVADRFQHIEAGRVAEFLKHVDDQVDWTVQGTHPLAGHYTSKRDFQVTPASIAQVLNS